MPKSLAGQLSQLLGGSQGKVSSHLSGELAAHQLKLLTGGVSGLRCQRSSPPALRLSWLHLPGVQLFQGGGKPLAVPQSSGCKAPDSPTGASDGRTVSPSPPPLTGRGESTPLSRGVWLFLGGATPQSCDPRCLSSSRPSPPPLRGGAAPPPFCRGEVRRAAPSHCGGGRLGQIGSSRAISTAASPKLSGLAADGYTVSLILNPSPP